MIMGMTDVTRLINSIEEGDPQAAEELLPIVYEELRRLAAAKMAREANAPTLQATALVHEAWLAVSRDSEAHCNSRNHFFKAAAEAVVGLRFDHQYVPEFVAQERLFELRDQIASGPGNDPLTQLARWFFSNRSRRPIFLGAPPMQ